MIHAILLAAGLSTRLKADKTILEVAGKPIIYYSLATLNDHPEIATINIVANKTNRAAIEKIVKQYRFKKVNTIILGGETRLESFQKGFAQLPKTTKPKGLVLVHNAANPLVSHEEISAIIEAAQEHGAAIVGHTPTSTIKEISHKHIKKTHDRSKLFAAQTPQAATFELFKKALKNPPEDATDESMLLEAIGHKVAHLPASEDNFKITTPSDLLKLRAILGETPSKFTVGIGQDSHEFENTLGLTLGGLHFPEYPKLKANSDGDVILHAITNALAQALGQKSLGHHADPLFKKGIIDSKKYLTPLLQKIQKASLEINTIGLMLECKTPQIDPINNQLKTSLAEIFQIPKTRIGITATSGEHLTSFGQGKGIQCFAIVSLKSSK